MEIWPQRHHWTNTLLGTLDEAFSLSPEEQALAAEQISRLLDALNIPNRGCPRVLPLPLVMEYSSGYFAMKLRDSLDGIRGSSAPRSVATGDLVADAGSWRTHLTDLIVTAYPDLSPEETVATDQVFSHLLGSLGLPMRRARFLPTSVQRIQSA